MQLHIQISFLMIRERGEAVLRVPRGAGLHPLGLPLPLRLARFALRGGDTGVYAVVRGGGKRRRRGQKLGSIPARLGVERGSEDSLREEARAEGTELGEERGGEVHSCFLCKLWEEERVSALFGWRGCSARSAGGKG